MLHLSIAISYILSLNKTAVTVEQGVQGDGSPPAGVWGVPSSIPSFSLAAAGGMG